LINSDSKSFQINGCSLLRRSVGRTHYLTVIGQGPIVNLEPTCSVLVEYDGRDTARGRLAMSKSLVLGAAALVFSAASVSAQVYSTPDYGYAEPVADLAVPADGYAAPAAPPVYTAPPVYAAPIYTAPSVVVVPAPVYATPLPAPVYAAPAVPHRVYAYAPGYWGGYGHGWHGYGHRWWH
jgi:hypothetical protein